MRRLFLVLAKLVGLLQLYWALVGFMQMATIFAVFARGESSQVNQVLISLIGVVVYFALSLGMAWLLLARTEWLADKLRIQDDGQAEELGKHPVLLVGIKLIGIYVTVHAIPSFVRVLLESRQIWEGQVDWYMWNKIVPTALELGLGLFLALKSDIVVDIITGKKELTQPPRTDM